MGSTYEKSDDYPPVVEELSDLIQSKVYCVPMEGHSYLSGNRIK